MQILMNGIRVNTDRLHKLDKEQLNHALGEDHTGFYSSAALREMTKEDLIDDLKKKIETMPKGKKGRRWSKSTTPAAAINKAHRIKKKVHFGQLTVDEAIAIRKSDPLLQEYLSENDIYNSIDVLDGFITFEMPDND